MDPTDTLLLLYEFEARAKLNDPKVEMVLESVLELQNVETKVLETIAGICNKAFAMLDSTSVDTDVYLSSFFVPCAALAMEPPAHFPRLCKKALRVALTLHKKQPQVDLARCRHADHRMAHGNDISSANHLHKVPFRVKALLIVQLLLCFSKCVHSLIKLSLPSGVSEVEARVLEEVWEYYEEALSIIAASVRHHLSRVAIIPRLPPPAPSQHNFSLLYN